MFCFAHLCIACVNNVIIHVLATSDESSDIGKKQFDLMKLNFTVVLSK